jgi:glycosyltransferase involved in cell wall biosynthesis
MDSEQAYTITTILEVLKQAERFDIIHAHLEWYSPLLASLTNVPVVMTFHGRLDFPWASHAFSYVSRGLVAISSAQIATHDDVRWEGVVHNGLDLSRSPFEHKRSDALCFVGRLAPEKGAVDAIEIARRTGRPLRIAAKKGVTPGEIAYFDAIFKPALDGAKDVEFLGELSGTDRDRLFAESYATLMPGSWPEPFGLVAIESLACGTPVISRRAGALPEIVREGIDGFFGDDEVGMAFRVAQVETLDRRAIHESVISRFSAKKMTDGYEKIYASMLHGREAGPTDMPSAAGSESVQADRRGGRGLS